MALPRIILIDDNPARGQQFLAVIQFLEYRGELYSAENFSEKMHSVDDVLTVFVGAGIDKQATVIKSVVELVTGIPVILLIDKGTFLQVPSAIQNLVTSIQEWPVTYAENQGNGAIAK